MIVSLVYFIYCRNEFHENDDQAYDGTQEPFNDSLPTSIAKQFCSIYDNDWLEAFNQINEHFEREKEEDIVKNIAVVTQVNLYYLSLSNSQHALQCQEKQNNATQRLKGGEA